MPRRCRGAERPGDASGWFAASFETGLSPPQDAGEEGVARRLAHFCSVRDLLRIAAGAFRRATCALLVRYRASRYLSALQRRATSRAHAHLRRRYGTWPASIPDCLSGTYVPAPGGCFAAARVLRVRHEARGRRTPSRSHERLARMPLEGRGEGMISEVRRVGIRAAHHAEERPQGRVSKHGAPFETAALSGLLRVTTPCRVSGRCGIARRTPRPLITAKAGTQK